MEKQTWDKILIDDITAMKNMLDEMQIELLKYSGPEAFGYLKPLRYMTVDALSDLYQHKWDRMPDIDNIIEKIEP